MIVNKDANRECYVGTNLTNVKNPVPSFYKEGATTIPKGSRFKVKLIIPKRGRIYFYNKLLVYIYIHLFHLRICEQIQLLYFYYIL